MHQPWSPQQQTSFQTGANSPGFFTPGFLESLQEDESESSSSFPFHVPTKNWNIEQNKPMEHDHAINVRNYYMFDKESTKNTIYSPLLLLQQKEHLYLKRICLFHYFIQVLHHPYLLLLPQVLLQPIFINLLRLLLS
jgi:hypothetical protein